MALVSLCFAAKLLRRDFFRLDPNSETKRGRSQHPLPWMGTPIGKKSSPTTCRRRLLSQEKRAAPRAPDSEDTAGDLWFRRAGGGLLEFEPHESLLW